jgi:hypothetical protein
MGASFEDLVETDLLVKTDLKSDLSFEWYNILKFQIRRASMWYLFFVL